VKRHPALQQLSRDHHHALVVAQRLTRADHASAAEARDVFLAYWATDGERHFREEEEILRPTCAGHMDVEQPIVAKVLTDHVQIRHLAAQASAGELRLTDLHDLGHRLKRHIRHEERELFPQIERSMPDTELQPLVDRLTRRGPPHRPPATGSARG
jgi:hypothetical protein